MNLRRARRLMFCRMANMADAKQPCVMSAVAFMWSLWYLYVKFQLEIHLFDISDVGPVVHEWIYVKCYGDWRESVNLFFLPATYKLLGRVTRLDVNSFHFSARVFATSLSL